MKKISMILKKIKLDKMKPIFIKLKNALKPLMNKLLGLIKSVLEVLKGEFKKASNGKMTLNEVLLKWNLSSLLIFWFIFRHVRFKPVVFVLMVYFMWVIYAIQKCSPKLSRKEKKKIKEEKASISDDEKRKQKKQKKKELFDKITLRRPWKEFNAKRTSIVLNLLVILDLLRKLTITF